MRACVEYRDDYGQAHLSRFAFRAMSPLFDIASFEVCGKQEGDKTVRLWARNDRGHLAMEASATLA